MAKRPWLYFVGIACTSCGGGGSLPAFGLLPEMRQLQPGDSCTYSYSGTLTPPGGTPAPVRGTAVNSVTARNEELVILQSRVTVNVYGQTVEMDSTATEIQKADGSIQPLSDNNGVDQSTRTVVSTTDQQPGTWMNPMSFGGKTTYSNGNMETNSVSVTGATFISTPRFGIEAFVANTSLQTNYGYSSKGTSYVSPGLGFFVYRNETVSDASAGIETVTFRLQSTTVPRF